MSAQQRMARLNPGILLEYLNMPQSASLQEVVVLLHRLPQKLYQFRHVMERLAEEGYSLHLQISNRQVNQLMAAQLGIV